MQAMGRNCDRGHECPFPFFPSEPRLLPQTTVRLPVRRSCRWKNNRRNQEPEPPTFAPPPAGNIPSLPQPLDMKDLIAPISTWTPDSPDAFHLEDSDDLTGVLRRLIDGRHPGLFTTVDEQNRPHTRWMATMAFEDFPFIHTLTAPGSRKLAQIEKNPHVTWVFSNHDLTLVLTLSGVARVLTDASERRRIWKTIEDKSHAYFLTNFREQPGFAVIETKVTNVEGCIPQGAFRWNIDVDSLRPAPLHHEKQSPAGSRRRRARSTR